jgi:hypothetical protein
MFRPEDFPLTTCSMLETFQESIPPWLTVEFNVLKNTLRQSLLTEDFSLLESSIAAMQPMVFTLRLHATPFLTNFDFATELSKIETTFKNTPLLFPQLTDTVRQLSFGIHLMSNFVKNLDTQNVNFLTNTSVVINQDHALYCHFYIVL